MPVCRNLNTTRSTNYIKPHLTEENNLEHLNFCMYMINPMRKAAGDYQFNEFLNVVHFDEKWFNITERKTGFLFAR